MQLLLAILLYLNVISPNNTYYQSYINTQCSVHSLQIDDILEDPIELETVTINDLPEVSSIIIIIDTGG